MKLEDCEVGMKVKAKCDLGIPIKKDKVYTIKRVTSYYIYFNQKGFCWSPKNFEPVNKFEVGDEILYGKYKQKAAIFGVKKTNNNSKRGNFAFALDLGGGEYTIAFSDNLSPLFQSLF